MCGAMLGAAEPTVERQSLAFAQRDIEAVAA